MSLGAILDPGTLTSEKRIVLRRKERANVRNPGIRSTAAIVAALSLGVAACGSDEGESSDGGASTAEPSETDEGAGSDAASSTDEPSVGQDAPTIVVTTNVLGNVVQEVVGDSAEVVTIMPVGADPHDFQASAQEVDAVNNADALIVNGAGFEEGLLDVIEAAEDEGVATFEAISVVETIEFGEGGHDHGDEDHADEDEHGDEGDHGDEDDHGDEEEHGDDDHGDEGEHGDDDHGDHSGVDPHFFTDPVRMAEAVEGIVDFLQDEIEFADPAALDASAEAYIAQLSVLDDAVAGLVDTIPAERRVLVTNHEVFGYFAERYGFEVVGAVVPGGSTTDSASAGELAELAEQVEAEAVPAIFADTSSSDDLVEALAAEVGDIAVVELYTESLGESGSDGATYLDMVLTNAERMSSALA